MFMEPGETKNHTHFMEPLIIRPQANQVVPGRGSLACKAQPAVPPLTWAWFVKVVDKIGRGLGQAAMVNPPCPS